MPPRICTHKQDHKRICTHSRDHATRTCTRRPDHASTCMHTQVGSCLHVYTHTSVIMPTPVCTHRRNLAHACMHTKNKGLAGFALRFCAPSGLTRTSWHYLASALLFPCCLCFSMVVARTCLIVAMNTQALCPTSCMHNGWSQNALS
jgi:hypothetical protein